MLSSPGCWKLYGEILAKDYSPEYFEELTHRIAVDAYAVTHPGDRENRKAIRSVNIHLISLYCIFEKGLGGKILLDIIKKAAEDSSIDKHYIWLAPPDFGKVLNVTDVLKTNSSSEHKKLVHDWGMSVWSLWKLSHEQFVESLVDSIVGV